MKTCKHCGEELPNTSEHFAIKKRNTDGLGGVCKPCLRIQQKDYEERNKEKVRNYQIGRTNKRREEQGLPPLSRKIAKEGHKICTVCDEELPATNEFFHNAKYSKDGLFTKCKECRNRENRERAAIERKKNKNTKIIESKYMSQRAKLQLEQQKKEELRDKKEEEIYKRLVSIPHNEGLQLNKLQVKLGQVYKIATPKKKGEPQGYFIGTLIQETKVHITLKNKNGRCESFLKADLLLREYEIKEVS